MLWLVVSWLTKHLNWLSKHSVLYLRLKLIALVHKSRLRYHILLFGRLRSFTLLWHVVLDDFIYWHVLYVKFVAITYRLACRRRVHLFPVLLREKWQAWVWLRHFRSEKTQALRSLTLVLGWKRVCDFSSARSCRELGYRTSMTQFPFLMQSFLRRFH